MIHDAKLSMIINGTREKLINLALERAVSTVAIREC